MSALTVTRPVCRYHGGKWRMAPRIIQELPPHRIYVEAFGGAGSILLRKHRSYAEVYNDLWDAVVNIFRCLRDPKLAEELRRRCELTPFARREFDESRGLYDDPADCVERARRDVFRSFAGHGSASMKKPHKTGFRSNSHRSGTTPAQDWANWPAAIPAFVERLRGVTIEHRDAVECMLQHDSPDTLHYLDPPYPLATRTSHRWNAVYRYDMTDEDHERLAAAAQELRGMVVISGYACELYDELYGEWDWIEIPSITDAAEPRVERLWFNQAAWSRRATPRLL